MQSNVDCIVHRPVCSVGKLKRIQWGSSNVLQVGQHQFFQMASWPQTLEPQACCHLVLKCWISLGWGLWCSVWSMKGLRTAPVICWISLWSWGSAQDFRKAIVTPSGPGAFFLFCFQKIWLTSSSLIWIAGVGERGLLEVLMDVWRGVQSGCGVFFFQICNRNHSDCLPVVDSPQCWGMVSCNWWSLSYLSTLKQNHWKRIGSLAYRNNSSVLFWSNFTVCIWPVYTRLYTPSCKHLLWPDKAVWVWQWTMVCHCCRLNESW